MSSRFASSYPIVAAVAFVLWVSDGLVVPAHGAGRQVLHQLRVTLDPGNARLVGKDILTFPSYDDSELVLQLAPTARVSSVSIFDSPARSRFATGRLIIPLPKSFSDRPLTVTIAYEAEFTDQVSASPLNTEDPTYGVTGAITPEGAFLLADAGWYPDLPGFDARFLVEIEVPEPFQAVTAGRRVGDRTQAGRRFVTWQIDHPIRGLSLSAAPYVTQSLDGASIPISTYFLPSTAALSETYLRAVRSYLELYQELFGPYPFERFDVVENFFPTGYGFPSYTLLGSSVIRLPFITRTSLGHEVAHSWWGNCVLVDGSRGNWSEGLVTYVADHLYRERESSDEARRYRMQILRGYATLVPERDDLPLREFWRRHSPASRSIGYGKGALLFHMVRRLTGEEAFWGGLRDVYRSKRFQEASWADFAEAFSRRSGMDLRPFFNQWVDRAGAPRLSLEGVTATKLGDRWEIRGALRQAEPPYDLTIPLRVEEQSGAKVDQAVRLKGLSAPFTIECKGAPSALVVDPDVDVLRRLHPSEIPADINRLRATSPLAVVLARTAPREWRQAAAVLLEGLGHPDAPILEEELFSTARYGNHSLLYVGMPEHPGFRARLPKGLEVRQDSFEWEGRRFEKTSNVLLAVLPSSPDPQRVEALLLPLSSGAAASAARKASHYGPYSVLIFEDGANLVKETWPITESPMAHRFAELSSP